MPPGKGDLDSAHLRELAAKCRRFAITMSDENTASALRRMAIEYEMMANGKDNKLRPPPPPIII